jgi:cytochrome c-type biogenesis protein
MTTPSETTRQQQRFPNRRILIFGGIILAFVLFIIAVLSFDTGREATMATPTNTSLVVMAVPAFLAGLLSFLSPCTLPILPAYFAFTFQANRKSIVLMSVAFFLGLATTMTILGAISTSLGQLVASSRDTLMFWGGLVVIGFGIMSLLGKGFAGPQVQERPVASVAGSYLYGATFALGWTACLGPILGSLFMLLAAQGVAIVQGAILSFIYALGLGMPLILLATFFSQLGSGSPFWKIMRGKGFEVQLGPWTLYLHTTSIASGVLLIAMGILLASGQLTSVTAFAQDIPFIQWMDELYFDLSQKFGL